MEKLKDLPEICTLSELLENAIEPLNVLQLKTDEGPILIAIATDGWSCAQLEMQCDLIKAYYSQRFGTPAQQIREAQKNRYIVELEQGCWVSDLYGDPGRTCTLVKANAAIFPTVQDAEKALIKAREFKPYKRAIITEAIADEVSNV